MRQSSVTARFVASHTFADEQRTAHTILCANHKIRIWKADASQISEMKPGRVRAWLGTVWFRPGWRSCNSWARIKRPTLPTSVHCRLLEIKKPSALQQPNDFNMGKRKRVHQFKGGPQLILIRHFINPIKWGIPLPMHQFTFFKIHTVRVFKWLAFLLTCVRGKSMRTNNKTSSWNESNLIVWNRQKRRAVTFLWSS